MFILAASSLAKCAVWKPANEVSNSSLENLKEPREDTISTLLKINKKHLQDVKIEQERQKGPVQY